MKFDLHLHSYFSDGRCSPEEVVKECKKLGLEVISLTDHENVGGIPEAIGIGKKLGIEIVPGIEFAADYQGKEHHILGYFIDYQSEKLKAFLDKWRKTKVTQIKKIVKNLQELGFKISFEEVMAQVRGSINRPHISWAVFQNSENETVLKERGIREQKEFFTTYLVDYNPSLPGKRGLAYVSRERPEIREVIDLIQDLGGRAFWAHPLWRDRSISRARERALIFRKFGLDGIETCYSFHTKDQVLALHRIAQDFSMFEGGGSDFHGEKDVMRQIDNFQTFGIELNLPLGRRTA